MAIYGVSCIFLTKSKKLSDDTASGSEAHDLSRVAKTQLLQNVCPMSLNSGRADGQQFSNFLAASTFSHQLQHFALPLGERVVSIGDAAVSKAAHVVVEDNLRNGRTEEGLAGPDRRDSLDELRAGRFLQEIAARASLYSLGDVGLVAVHAEDQHTH